MLRCDILAWRFLQFLHFYTMDRIWNGSCHLRLKLLSLSLKFFFLLLLQFFFVLLFLFNLFRDSLVKQYLELILINQKTCACGHFHFIKKWIADYVCVSRINVSWDLVYRLNSLDIFVGQILICGYYVLNYFLIFLG